MSTAVPVIVGIGETGNVRPAKDGDDTHAVLGKAVAAALADAGIPAADVDGLGLWSYSLPFDKAGDLGWRLGLTLRWVVDCAPAATMLISTLGLARRAIENGDASVIVLVAGDSQNEDRSTFRPYNRAQGENVAPLGSSGPNTLFAMLTTRQMRALGLSKEDYGNVVIGQRRWASKNPVAVHRGPLTMQEYLEAPMICDPLRRYDCPPLVTGANALVITTEDRCPPGRRPVHIRALGQRFNVDNQLGDGLTTPLATFASDLFDQAGIAPGDLDAACLYDDYPAVVLAQLVDLGLTDRSSLSRFLAERVVTGDFPLNTHGGLLSAGQAGGGLHGVVEMTRQLQGRAGERQVAGADLALAAGYGQVLYRHGSSSSAVILQGGE